MVRDGLWRKESWPRRRQGRQARDGNQRDCGQRKRLRDKGNGREGIVFQRRERQEACEEKVSPAREPMADATQTKGATARRVRKAVLPAAGLGTRFLPAT